MRLFIIYGAFLLASHATSDQAALKRTFNELYVQMNGRYVALDVNGVAAFMRSDYVYTNRAGKSLRRKEFLAGALSLLKSMSNVTRVDMVNSVTMDHGRAKVTYHEVFMSTQTVLVGHPHTTKQMSKVTDVWYPAGIGWRLKQTRVDATTSYVDGKKVNLASYGLQYGMNPVQKRLGTM